MRKLVSILILLPLLALSTGALGFMHSQAHRMQDEHCHHDDQAPPSDDSSENCFIHAQLAAPITDAAPLAPLIESGLFVAFLTQLPDSVVSFSPLHRIDCRGPPVC